MDKEGGPICKGWGRDRCEEGVRVGGVRNQSLVDPDILEPNLTGHLD